MPKLVKHEVTPINWGSNIAIYRKKAGLTQEFVAEKLDITTEQVSRIERGTSIPNVVRLMELATLFNCPVSVLLNNGATRQLDQADYLNALLLKLEPKDRSFVIGIVEQLVEHIQSSDD